MERLLFRCLDTLVDASALERRAFNAAFAQSGLKWHWSAARFSGLKKIAGERHRIAWYAEHIRKEPISCSHADLILWRKEQALCQLLQHSFATPRPGVLRLLREAAEARIPAVVSMGANTQHQILNKTASHFNPLSILTVATPDIQLDRHPPASIEFDTAISAATAAHGVMQSCITVFSNLTGDRACITHFGEINNPARQLSGNTILRNGRASMQSLLKLEFTPVNPS